MTEAGFLISVITPIVKNDIKRLLYMTLWIPDKKRSATVIRKAFRRDILNNPLKADNT